MIKTYSVLTEHVIHKLYLEVEETAYQSFWLCLPCHLYGSTIFLIHIHIPQLHKWIQFFFPFSCGMQVLEKALEVWDLQVIPLDCPVAEPAQVDPQLENAFICHLQDHWFCIRKVDGEWYNFDSLYAAPEHLSKFYLSAYLDTLKGFGWSIFLVRGSFPKECPISSSEASNGFGQWLSPEDAQRITKSCNATSQATPPGTAMSQPSDHLQFTDGADRLSDMEEKELNAAIAASLMDSAAALTKTGTPENNNQ